MNQNDKIKKLIRYYNTNGLQPESRWPKRFVNDLKSLLEPEELRCDYCNENKDIKIVQLRNGWGKSFNGFHPEKHSMCTFCRNRNHGAYRIVKSIEV